MTITTSLSSATTGTPRNPAPYKPNGTTPIMRVWPTLADALTYMYNHIHLLEMEGWERIPSKSLHILPNRYGNTTTHSESYETFLHGHTVIESITVHAN